MNFARLRILLIASFMLVSLVPLAVLGVFIISQGQAHVKDRASSYLKGLSDRNAEIIRQYMEERLNDIFTLSDSINISGIDNRNLKRQLDLVNTGHKHYIGFFLQDASGRTLYATRDTPVDLKMMQQIAPTESNGSHPAVKGIFMLKDNDNRIPALVVCSPLTTGSQQVSGHLYALVDFRVVGHLLQKSNIEITGEVYLIDKTGLFLSESRFGARALEDQVSFSAVDNAANGIHEIIDYRGERVLQAFRKVETFPWYVMADQDMSEILNLVKQLEKKAVLYGLLTALIVFGLALFVSTGIVNLLKAKYQYEKELEFQVIQKEKLASLGLLTSGLAHELNTPLANALLYTQIAKEELDEAGLPPGIVQERLSTVADEIRQGSRIVRNLLDFSRHSQTDAQITDANAVVTKLMNIAGPHCTSNKINVKMHLGKDLPAIHANASTIQAIVTNLVANAIEAMPDGGTLELVTFYEPVTKMVKIKLADTGPGIPKEALIKIFNPFYTTKKPGEGTGLGLFISHEMARKLGGDLKVVSSKAEDAGQSGTVFTAEFPAE